MAVRTQQDAARGPTGTGAERPVGNVPVVARGRIADLLALQQSAGNAAVARLLAGRASASRAAVPAPTPPAVAPAARAPATPTTAATAAGETHAAASQAVARSILDDAIEGAQQLASDAYDTAQEGTTGVADAIASRFGGHATAVGTGMRVDIPDIPLVDSEQLPPLELPVPPLRAPLFAAGAEMGPVALEADIALELALRPEITVVLGPVSLRDIHVTLDPLAGDYTATAQLHGAASETLLAPIDAGVDVEAVAVILVDEVPVPIEVDALGGLRLTLRGTGLGSLDEAVNLAVHGSSLLLDTATNLKLGARFDAELDAIVELNVYEHPVCIYTWPLQRWDIGEAAEQYTLPLSFSYGPDGPGFDHGPITAKPIPVREIEAVVPHLPKTRDCQFLDRLIEVLCREGIIPPELCSAGSPSAPGPAGLGPGHGGGPFQAQTNFPSGLTPNNKDDHIPIRWVKPLAAYPDPIRLTPSSGGTHDYEMTTPNQFVEPGHAIGVESGFLPEVGKSVQLERVIEEIDRGPGVDRFRSLLTRHGWVGTGFDIDHVQDVGWGGPDEPMNLWPLDSGFNRNAGNRFQQLRLTYSNVRGGGPATPTTTNVRLADAARAAGADNIIGRWFIIESIRP